VILNRRKGNQASSEGAWATMKMWGVRRVGKLVVGKPSINPTMDLKKEGKGGETNGYRTQDLSKKEKERGSQDF